MDDLLIYTDENDSKKTIYVKIIEIGLSHVMFRTNSENIITIPMSRVIKIKQKEARRKSIKQNALYFNDMVVEYVDLKMLLFKV